MKVEEITQGKEKVKKQIAGNANWNSSLSDPFLTFQGVTSHFLVCVPTAFCTDFYSDVEKLGLRVYLSLYVVHHRGKWLCHFRAGTQQITWRKKQSNAISNRLVLSKSFLFNHQSTDESPAPSEWLTLQITSMTLKFNQITPTLYPERALK